jgi:hypothetical protein
LLILPKLYLKSLSEYFYIEVKFILTMFKVRSLKSKLTN